MCAKKWLMLICDFLYRNTLNHFTVQKKKKNELDSKTVSFLQFLLFET